MGDPVVLILSALEGHNPTQRIGSQVSARAIDQKRPAPKMGAGPEGQEEGSLPALANDIVVALCNGLTVNLQQCDHVL